MAGMGPRAVYECYQGQQWLQGYRGAHRRLRSGLSHTRPGAEHTEAPVRNKTHKVCSFFVFRNQFSRKNKVGMGTEGLR